MATLDAALSYADRNWPVLPLHHVLTGGGCSCGRVDCPSVGKHPRLWHGVHEASTDPAQVQEWWRRWPRANVGIATGDVAGFDVLDIDPRNGGDETLRELVAEYGDLPETVEQLTGGGGRHLLFEHVDGLGAKVGAGLDVRSSGSLIVAPPSGHASGRRYAWEATAEPDSAPIAPWPAWLLTLAGKAERSTSISSPRRGTVAGNDIPIGRWGRVLAGCKRLRELESVQRTAGVDYPTWLATVAVARLGGDDGHRWVIDFTTDYAGGCSSDDLSRLAAWLGGNLQGTATCAALGCNSGICGFRPRVDETGHILEPSPLRHAWSGALTVEVA
jgi:hypothetical protein